MFKFNLLRFFGGHKISEKSLQGKCIAISTPGKLEKALEVYPHLKTYLKSLEVLVIDEADRFSDWESQKSIKSIFEVLPKQRRTSLFSATQAKYIEDLLKFSLINPIRLTVTNKQNLTVNEGLTSAESSEYKFSVAPTRLRNYFITVPAERKLLALTRFLLDNVHSKILLFMSNSASVIYFSEVLKKILPDRFTSCIHGKMKDKRKKILKEFRERKESILLCTDIMARGIDVNDIDWVVQFDFPKNSELFVHRTGRSGRNGKEGQSLIILTDSEAAYSDFIQKHEETMLIQFNMDGLDENSVKNLKKQVHDIAIEDRKILELGSRAFVSYIQAYSKSDCQYICNLRDLDVVGMANSFGLLKFPKMVELIGRRDLQNFKSPLGVQIHSITFKDAKLEQKRQDQLKKNIFQGEKFNQKVATARVPKRKSEWDELQEEERMLKKFKKGKITKKELEETLNKI